MRILSRRVKKSRRTDLSKWDFEMEPERYRLIEALLSYELDGDRTIAVRVYWSDGYAVEYVDEADVDSGVVGE